ncbi:MAG: lactate utilization protein [Syntrophomonadaceae bacterium]|jgi:hypothetical protein|nr:lactate utilization protein [Syntrophomonadaceae bacterium]
MNSSLELRSWLAEQKCRAAIKALGKSGFDAVYCPTAPDAAEYIIKAAADALTIGFGGSMSVNELRIHERLRAMDKKLLIHNQPEFSPEQNMETRRLQLVCDLFITGTNALTLEGQLVNIDGTGNRVAAMIFGPKKVIVVAGRNKLVANAAQAIERIKNIAAPANAKRLNYDLSCVKTGFCSDCRSPQRICNITVILEKKPIYSDITVLVVNDDLGL